GGGGGYARYFIEAARASAGEGWVPMAARLYRLSASIEASGPFRRNKAPIAEFHRLAWVPVLGPARIRALIKANPGNAHAENAPFADEAESLAREVLESGQQIRMPPAFVHKIRNLKAFVAASRARTGGSKFELRWSLRGSDPETGLKTFTIDTATWDKRSIL